MITKPDKGNGVVIISRLDYLYKMKNLISDTTKFKELQHNQLNPGKKACQLIFGN